MVRSYILSDGQREAVKDYVTNRRQNMPGGIRSIRHRLKFLDFDEMEEDILLLRKLNTMKIPIGRKAKEVPAKLVVRQKTGNEVKAKLEVK